MTAEGARHLMRRGTVTARSTLIPTAAVARAPITASTRATACLANGAADSMW
jgi:hypothetical protein